MTRPVPRKGLLRSLIYPLLQPIYHPRRHRYHLLKLRAAGSDVSKLDPLKWVLLMRSGHGE